MNIVREYQAKRETGSRVVRAAVTPGPENCLFIHANSCLPAGLLGGGLGPLAGGGGGSSGTGLPASGLSLAPLSASGGGGGEGSSRGSLPVSASSGVAGLDGSRALLLNTGELLLLNLLLGLSLRVAVCEAC